VKFVFDSLDLLFLDIDFGSLESKLRNGLATDLVATVDPDSLQGVSFVRQHADRQIGESSDTIQFEAM